MTRPEVSLDDVNDAARRMIDMRVVGALTSVDAAGCPHTRWMAAAAQGDDMSTLISITARGSRKLDQLAINPRVCWLFADSHDDEIITLTGTMRLLESQTLAEPVWQKLEVAARKYSMNLLSEPENLWFVGLETTVTSIEYMHPSAGLTHPVIHTLA